jgi:hypothetical protein
MTEASASSTAPEPGAIARTTGVLFSPGKTFESIGRKPGLDWLLPVVLMVLLALTAGLLINPKLDTDTALKDTMKRMEARGIPEAQRDKIRTRVENQYAAVKSGWLRFLGPVFILIPLFFVPAVYLGIAKAMGAAAKYGTIFAGYAFCQVPQILKGIIALAVGWTRDSIDLNEVEHLVKSNVGSFLDVETTGKPLMAILNSVDLFEIWGLLLGSMMLARTTKLSKNGATISVVSVWLLYVLFKVGGAALGAAFGG